MRPTSASERFGSSARACSCAVVARSQKSGGLRTVRSVLGLVQVALPERRPGRSVVRIEPDGALEHPDGLPVRPRVARQGLAPEVEVVRLGALRARGGIARAGRGAESREQSLPHALRHLVGERDEVGGGVVAVSRQTTRSASVSTTSIGHAEPVAFLLEVAGEDARDLQVPAGGLRVDVSSGVPPRRRERADREPGDVGEGRGDFVGKREAQVVDRRVPGEVLERQDRDDGLPGGRGCGRAAVPHRPAEPDREDDRRPRCDPPARARRGKGPAPPRRCRSRPNRSRASGASGPS